MFPPLAFGPVGFELEHRSGSLHNRHWSIRPIREIPCLAAMASKILAHRREKPDQLANIREGRGGHLRYLLCLPILFLSSFNLPF